MIRNQGGAGGFTLIELMMTAAVIAIISMIAYPSYVDQINKSKRATAAKSILECASVLERRFTLKSTFAATDCDNVTNDDYTITVVVSGLTRNNRSCTSNGKQNCYVITATSLISGDTLCQTMSYNEQGVKKANDGNANTKACWRTS